MKNLPFIVIVLLAFACNKPGEQTASSGDSTTTAPDPSTKPANVVIWNEVSVRDAASEKGKYLTSIYLGEKFEVTGDTASELSGSKRNHYHKITLSDGKIGWVRDEFIAIGVRPAALISNSTIYKRPDMATVTDKQFGQTEFVVIRKADGKFLEVTGKPVGEKWFITGFINSEDVSDDENDVEYAAMKRRAAEETKESVKQALLKQLDDENIFGESLLWVNDHGNPGAMGHAGAGVEDPSDESEAEDSQDSVSTSGNTGDPNKPHMLIEPPADGLVGFYPLDDRKANDASGNNLDGQVFNAVAATDKANSPNGAMYFDHTSYITIPDLNIKPPFTVAAYFKLDDNSLRDQCVVSRGRSGEGTGFNFGYSVKDDGSRVLYLGMVGFRPVGVEQPVTLGSGAWVYMAATYDGTTARLYVNGQLANSAWIPGNDAQAIASNLQLSQMPTEIGRELETLDRYFKGSIDNVALWNRALTPQEIASMYRQ